MKFAMKETADMVERRYKYIGYIYISLYFGQKDVDQIRIFRIKTIIKKD